MGSPAGRGRAIPGQELRLVAEQMPLAANTDSPGLARQFVAERLERWELRHLIPEAVLMTSELASNAVKHVGQPFTVEVDNLGDGVRVTVADPSPEPPTPRQTSVDEIGGRGLNIVEAMATSTGVTLHGDSGKAVWFELRSDSAGT
ncbi:MAG: ATP-binding protein [Acidimicrobiales bacterium]